MIELVTVESLFELEKASHGGADLRFAPSNATTVLSGPGLLDSDRYPDRLVGLPDALGLGAVAVLASRGGG